MTNHLNFTVPYLMVNWRHYEQSELLPLTGYVHGGCSPIGMKKQFKTVAHITANDFETIFVSAGKIGYQVELNFADMQKVINIKTADIIT